MNKNWEIKLRHGMDIIIGKYIFVVRHRNMWVFNKEMYANFLEKEVNQLQAVVKENK